MDMGRQPLAMGEQRLRIAQRIGVAGYDDLAAIAHADALERHVHLVGDTASLEFRIGRNRRALELAGDAAVRQVEADGEFGITLVHPVAEPHPATHWGG